MSFLAERSHQVRAIAAAIGCIVVVGVGLSLSIPLLAFVMAEMGASGTMIGLNTAMGGVATILVAPIIPQLAARVGVRGLILVALLLGGAVFMAFYYATALWMLFPLRFLFGAALAVLFVLSEFWINAAAPERSRGFVMGIYATMLSLGFAAGPALLAFFAKGSIIPYVTGALLFLAAAVPLAFADGVAPKLHRSPEHNFIGYLRAAPSAVFAAFIFGAVETGGMSFLPLYGVHIGYSEALSATLVSVLALGNVLVQIPLGLVSDRVDRRHMLLTLGVIGAIGAALLPLVADNTAILFPLVAVWGGLIAGLYTVGLAHLGASFRGADLAGANATYVMMYSLGMLAGPPIIGVGFDVWDPHGMPAAIVLLFVLYVAVVIHRLRTLALRRRAATADAP